MFAGIFCGRKDFHALGKKVAGLQPKTSCRSIVAGPLTMVVNLLPEEQTFTHSENKADVLRLSAFQTRWSCRVLQRMASSTSARAAIRRSEKCWACRAKALCRNAVQWTRPVTTAARALQGCQHRSARPGLRRSCRELLRVCLPHRLPPRVLRRPSPPARPWVGLHRISWATRTDPSCSTRSLRPSKAHPVDGIVNVQLGRPDGVSDRDSRSTQIHRSPAAARPASILQFAQRGQQHLQPLSGPEEGHGAQCPLSHGGWRSGMWYYRGDPVGYHV